MEGRNGICFLSGVRQLFFSNCCLQPRKNMKLNVRYAVFLKLHYEKVQLIHAALVGTGVSSFSSAIKARQPNP